MLAWDKSSWAENNIPSHHDPLQNPYVQFGVEGVKPCWPLILVPENIAGAKTMRWINQRTLHIENSILFIKNMKYLKK